MYRVAAEVNAHYVSSGRRVNKEQKRVSAYRFAADWLAIHVSSRWGQGLPISPFVIGDESGHFAIHLLIGQEDSFDSTYLGKKVNLQSEPM